MQDGKLDMVQAASASIHGPHGQYIENVHLEPFESEAQFWDLHYNGAYSRLLRKAEDFVKNTGGTSSDDTLVLIRRAVFPFVVSRSDIGGCSVPDSTLQNMKRRRCHGTIGRSQPLFSITSRGMSVRSPISGPKAES